jgi:hypothetical protein
MRLTFLLPALMALATAGQAADNTCDFRFSLGLVSPGIEKNKITDSTHANGNWDPANDGTETLSAKNGFSIEPGVVWGHRIGREGWGLVLGGNLFYRTGGGDIGNTTITFTATGLKFLVGPSFQFEKWQFEITPFFGIGSVEGEVKAGGFSLTSDTGLFIDGGIAGRAVYFFNDHFSAGLIIGIDSFVAVADFDATSLGGDKQTNTATGSGPIVALTAGWKL